jgi:dynein light intermediate chain 1
MTVSNRFSAASGGSETKNGEKKKEGLWSALLDSVASGKRLPEKNLLVLGELCQTPRS